jgi:Rod binding domain-containing protein
MQVELNPNISNQNSNVSLNADLRQAAAQFEALLLNQLTSALTKANTDGEDSLFGNEAGSNLAQQMFSEQLATTIANAGGIGLADIIMNQLQGQQTKANPILNKTISNAVYDIKNRPQKTFEPMVVSTVESTQNNSVLPNSKVNTPKLNDWAEEHQRSIIDQVSPNSVFTSDLYVPTRPRIVSVDSSNGSKQ